MLMFSTVMLVLGSTLSIVHGTQLIPVKQCNLTVLHPVLRSLDGIMFTCTPSDNVTYFFSICGLRQENTSISITSRPAALQRYVSGPTANYEPLAYSESSDDDVQFFEKKSHRILKLSSHPDGLCAVVLAFRCGRESELLRLFDEQRRSSCIRLFELYHPSLCGHMLPPHVLTLILLSLLGITVFYFSACILYNKTVYNLSWHDSIPHIHFCDNLGSGFCNRIRRLRDRKLYRAARTKYMRVANIPADHPTKAATITKGETVCLVGNRRISISADDDSEDQILLTV
ncbi:hypothetical protein EG68_07208 [Paragonimus skrjabini miyazakii]|uniref:Uncharacterized protein n=1 Tax=Paragonimus skrjabini miyazakii TaxID=59628 RepID=A0A8S9Z357_9TREM|nr:hypothetical protein EG68_07208 [Paragonimus skrjabini miyazakii]